MADGNILSDFGIDLLEEEIDDVIFQTNEFLTDATFTGSQGPFWWILQMCMALAALFAIVMAAGMAYKMMVKHEPLDVMKLFRPLAVSLILCWWYPPADTGMANSGSNWCFLDFLSYIPNCVGSYTHDLYEAEASQISDKFEKVQELIYVRDTMYTALQAQADVAHTGTSDPNLIEATMEQTGVDEVTNMEKDAAKLWFTSLTSGVIVGIDKIIILIALVVFRIGWWATIYCQQILLGMLTIFGPIQWAFSLLPKWEGAWAKWLTRYLTVHFYGAMLYFVGFISSLSHCKLTTYNYINALRNKPATRMHQTKKYHRKKSVRAAKGDVKVAKIPDFLRFRLKYFHPFFLALARKIVVGFYSFSGIHPANLLFPFISYQRKTMQQYRMDLV